MERGLREYSRGYVYEERAEGIFQRTAVRGERAAGIFQGIGV